ncbi:MAG: hypothetical protein H7Y41_01035 [Hyphomonadaceae bacterium]|nr:hypothetical protein [Clostridia bacterium]
MAKTVANFSSTAGVVNTVRFEANGSNLTAYYSTTGNALPANDIPWTQIAVATNASFTAGTIGLQVMITNSRTTVVNLTSVFRRGRPCVCPIALNSGGHKARPYGKYASNFSKLTTVVSVHTNTSERMNAFPTL